MLGVAGAAPALEAITGVSWTDAPVQESQTYLGATVSFSLPVVVGIEIFVMAYVEQQRSQESDPMKRLYPGGIFDPAASPRVRISSSSSAGDRQRSRRHARLRRYHR